MLLLQTNVATFGAQIQDLTVGMDELKERFRDVQKTSHQNQENLTELVVSGELKNSSYLDMMAN